MKVLRKLDDKDQRLLQLAQKKLESMYETKISALATQKKVFWTNFYCAGRPDFPFQQQEGEIVSQLVALMESLIAEFNLPRRLLSICISTNPVGTTDQPSHIDYSGITSSLFIPLTPVVTQNTIAYFEPELSDADKQRIIGCTSGEEIYATLAAIQQEISADMREIRSAYKPFSVVYLPAATVHRAVGNNSGFDRKMVCVMLTDDENYQMDEGEMEQGNY